MAKEKKMVTCAQCNGQKKKLYPGRTKKETCRYCGGTGKVAIWV